MGRYDHKAGFWGAMGGPCLGIIPVRPSFQFAINSAPHVLEPYPPSRFTPIHLPPFPPLPLSPSPPLPLFPFPPFPLSQSGIDDLESPLPSHCAGGTTKVWVNGRELHRKDLWVLMKRGLPDLPGTSYSVDFSGQVLDEATGEVLPGLGRLQPS